MSGSISTIHLSLAHDCFLMRIASGLAAPCADFITAVCNAAVGPLVRIVDWASSLWYESIGSDPSAAVARLTRALIGTDELSKLGCHSVELVSHDLHRS